MPERGRSSVRSGASTTPWTSARPVHPVAPAKQTDNRSGMAQRAGASADPAARAYAAASVRFRTPSLVRMRLT
jgi:hypothetical protein